MKKWVTVFFLFPAIQLFCQQVEVYPSNWWIGMKHNKIQLLLHSSETLDTIVSLTYPGIKLEKTYTFPNRKYLALDLTISPDAKAGIAKLHTSSHGIKQSIDFPLYERRKGNGIAFAKGVTSSDLIYLIMPDRFSNGDPSNDRYSDLRDTSCDRMNPFLRHGGDFKGIINHLNYLSELGVSAIWLTPVVENDTYQTLESGSMRSSYHGYHFTNQFKIDKRFGGNTGYKEMIDSAHARNIKVIQDAVYNHFSKEHFLYLDPPAGDWFNRWDSYTNTSYKDQPLVDPHAAEVDRRVTVDGWFTPFLPDVNQKNKFVARFLIQHALWTVEEFGIDGWRVDTYFYSDKEFLNAVNEALYTEYPGISIFGETTMQSVTEQAYFTRNKIDLPWKSNLEGVTDFQWQGGAIAGLKEDFGWSSGIMRLYNVLVQDILYKDPMRNVIFLDNHDQDRIFSVLNEDIALYKIAITLLLTQRGIPQLYYGTEILMKNFKDPSDAEVRRDFPGGWQEDSSNKFNRALRNIRENEAFDFVKSLSRFRQQSKALQNGELLQYIPENGVYVYFRIMGKERVMIVINTTDKDLHLATDRFVEGTGGYNNFVDVILNRDGNFDGGITIQAKASKVLKLK